MPNAKQSTWVASLLVLLLGAIAVTALAVYPIEGFLKVWAVLGTLVGVVTGAIPGFFFATSAQQHAAEASKRQSAAEGKLETVLGMAQPEVLERAQQARPDLFATPTSAEGGSDSARDPAAAADPQTQPS